uniref:Uncharacterized protein n=1 Tax=Anguilla anguilla TaxID=7936 RepID=A0A0E9SWU3_ANGAN
MGPTPAFQQQLEK